MTKTETKHEKFVRIAENRTNRIIDTLQLLENCANPNNYDYSKNEVDQIFNAIQKQLNETKLCFERSVKNDNGKFKLK